jgi:hypothetical protein
MIVVFETYNMCTFFLLVNAIASFSKPLMLNILLVFLLFPILLVHYTLKKKKKVSYKFKIIVYKFKLVGSSLYIEAYNFKIINLQS